MACQEKSIHVRQQGPVIFRKAQQLTTKQKTYKLYNLVFDRINNKSPARLDVANSYVVNSGDSYNETISEKMKRYKVTN